MGRRLGCTVVAIAVFLPLGCKATTGVESSPLLALERMNGSMVADVSFTAIDPGIRSDRVADTMILSCLERGGTTYEVRVPLGRRVDYFWSPR